MRACATVLAILIVACYGEPPEPVFIGGDDPYATEAPDGGVIVEDHEASRGFDPDCRVPGGLFDLLVTDVAGTCDDDRLAGFVNDREGDRVYILPGSRPCGIVVGTWESEYYNCDGLVRVQTTRHLINRWDGVVELWNLLWSLPDGSECLALYRVEYVPAE